jgi:fructokinase
LRIVTVGEILWDVIGEREYLGGAPLNFAAHAQKLGHEAFLVSAVGDDERGRRTLDSLRQWGLAPEFVQALHGKDTGTAQVELDCEGKPTFRIVRPAAYDFVTLTKGQLRSISELQPDWIYFGTLYHMSSQALDSTLKLLEAAPCARHFYDVNLREGNWSLALVEQLASHANVIKLSDSEAEFLDGLLNAGGQEGSVEYLCRRWIDRYHCDIVCVTLGERGCAILNRDTYTESPGYKVQVADSVGAGDAFAAGLLHGLEQQWDTRRLGCFANAVGALVASRPGATPKWNINECWPMLGERFDRQET